MALLDSRLGAGWRDAIDVDRLDIRSGGSCVLGQLYGGYGWGADKLKLGAADGVAYGFEASSKEMYGRLTNEWRLALSA